MSSSTDYQSKPTTILTGFLGAGKTTYLNHLLKTNPDTRYAIIENEFGEQNIDSDLIIRAEDGIVELNNGCLCCTLNENLFDILNTLFDRKEEYDELIIEATGVANPVGLAEPFVMHPAIKSFFPISSIICLIDAELIEEQLEETEEALSQITYSDVLLINKTDLVAEDQLNRIKAKLARLNPLARVFEGSKEGFPEIHSEENRGLFNEMHHSEPEHAHSHDNESSFPVNKPHSHHHHDHTEEIGSISFIFEQAFDYKKLSHHLNVYLLLQSKGLYRMKGLVWVKDSDQQYVVQSVGKRLDFSEKEKKCQKYNIQSKIVFIGKNLQRKGLERLLSRCFP